MADIEMLILAILFLTCVVYSILLERIHDLYTPNWIVLTVICGVGFIWLALMNIERYGIPLTGWGVFRALCAGGAPIVGWQLWQILQRAQEARTG